MPSTEYENYVKCDLLVNIYQVQKENGIICSKLCLCALYKLLIKKEIYFQIVFDYDMQNKRLANVVTWCIDDVVMLSVEWMNTLKNEADDKHKYYEM